MPRHCSERLSKISQTFDLVRTSIPVLTTSPNVVAWPQGDQFLGGGMWHTGPGSSNPMAFASVLYPGRCLASQPTGPGGERAVAQGDQFLGGDL